MGKSVRPRSEFYADRFAEIIRRAIRFKHHFRAVLPEQAAQARARLRKLLPQGFSDDDADFNLYYELGAILSQAEMPLTMSELSQAVEVPFSTATRLVDSLVELGYAERLSDPSDRRLVRVGLTAQGKEMYRAIDAMIRQRIDLLLARFSPEECETLLTLVDKIFEALAEESGQAI
jgi:DNA-binding MarR family transcriptional regulator